VRAQLRQRASTSRRCRFRQPWDQASALTPAPTNPVSFPVDSENFGTVRKMISPATQFRSLKVFASIYLILYVVVTGFAGKYSLRDGASIASLRSMSAFVVLSVAISIALFFYVTGISKGVIKIKDVIFASLFPIGLFSLALLDIYSDTNWFKNYGDVFYLKDWINANIPVTKWLVGTTLLIDVFEFINNMVRPISAPVFITATSALCMFVSTMVVLKTYGNKAYIVLPLTSPIWLLLSSGYDEYYPFIAGVFLTIALWILLDREISNTTVFFVVAGVMPAIYLGFVPLGGFILVKLFFKEDSVKRFFLGVAISAASFVFAVEVSWPMGHSNFLGHLYNQLKGADSQVALNYDGSRMTESLPFYSLQSVLFGPHLRDVLFSVFFAGGIAALGLVFLFLWKVGKNLYSAGLTGLFAKRKISLPVIFFAYNVSYLAFVQTGLGRAMDIDLFFGQNLVLAIWCGFLLEKIFDEYALDSQARSIALSAFVSLNGPIVAALLIYGIQR
jgi:hypothetical protein